LDLGTSPKNLHAPAAHSATSKINLFLYDAKVKMGNICKQSKLARGLVRWYELHRRDLPWRPALGTRTRVDPYWVMVSEFMLQQTQVATVIPYYKRFLTAFPTIQALADAPEQGVLRLWQGLGYYSRARNLHAAAKEVVGRHGGKVPFDLDALQSLPGIGRYTAGAIASIAFGLPCPILDGNVARVLCRLHDIQTDPREPKTRQRLWQIAAEMVPARNCGEFNSALMELGATVCTPRQPGCTICPIRDDCGARAAGTQNAIPPRRKAKPTPIHDRQVFCIRHKNEWLIERRPLHGRWAGLWQFPTIKAELALPTKLHGSLRIANPQKIGEIRHALTHRRYIFTVYLSSTRAKKELADARWIGLNQLSEFPLSRPQQSVAELLRDLSVPN
jgi:A/G-specific adenine glycosylase